MRTHGPVKRYREAQLMARTAMYYSISLMSIDCMMRARRAHMQCMITHDEAERASHAVRMQRRRAHVRI